MNDVSGCKMRYIGFNATLFLAVLSIINANAEARKIFGSDEVHIPDEVSSLVKKTLTEMNIKFEKAPLQSVEFQCKNDATEKLLSTFPNAVIRWMYNGENIKIRPASMMMSIDSLVIQNLLPKDSGVYHCVVMVTPKQPVVTAVYSLVVGENWIHTFSTSKLVLSCNSKGLGSLFRNAVRTWNHRLGKETASALKEDAIFNSVDLRFSGTWTCIVTDIKTKRTWVTARYKVIVDPPPPFLVRLKIRAMDNKTAAFGIVFGTLFFCMVIYEGLVERFKKKNESFKKEMDFFKTTLHLDVPITGTVNEAVSDTLSLENESLLQNNETTDKTEG